MIPRPGDVIVYKSYPEERFEVTRIEPGTGDKAGRFKVFAHKFGSNGHLERDWEAWFMFPPKVSYLCVEHVRHEIQLDLFGD